MMRFFIVLSIALALTACARTEATRLSANTVLIDAGAAPACGRQGAARVAAKSAAIETIRAGFDKYVIAGAQSENNVRVTQLPGQARTVGTMTYGGGFGPMQSTTTYVPGPTIVGGSHDRALTVVMFKNGQAGSENALDAREMLGPEWPELVKNGIRTCL